MGDLRRLAQQAAYVSRHVQRVFAFNSSFVTGHYSVPKKKRRQNQAGMQTYRIYEHGEVLAYLRLAVKSVYPLSVKDPKIVELRYDVLEGHVVAQHSMRELALKLRELAAGSGPGPQPPAHERQPAASGLQVIEHA